jgi:tetratricopeptide (TPR) repeat protein
MSLLPLLRASSLSLVTVTWILASTARSSAQDSDEDSSGNTSLTTLVDARDLLLTGSYERAIEAYERLATNPQHALSARLGAARCRLQIGLYGEAISALTSLDADDSAELHHLLAVLYQRVGRYDKALTHVRSAIARSAASPLVGADTHAGARRLHAGMLELLGRREEAIAAYRWFDEQLVGRAELQRNAEWITEIALGFLRYSVLTRNKELPRRARHVLNEMLQVAYERVDRTYWPARIAAADLLRERYNNDEEDGSISDYKAALRINENLPQAYVGMGEVALQRWDFEEVERLARRALNVNPNDAPALHLLAGKLVLERRYGQAIEVCERALAINPNDLSALSISAAASACQYDDGELRRTSSRVAAINPRCALLHRTLGDALSGIRQYAASEAEYKKAIEIDPTDANAHTELGMMYMQWGAEKKARAVLDRSSRWNFSRSSKSSTALKPSISSSSTTRRASRASVTSSQSIWRACTSPSRATTRRRCPARRSSSCFPRTVRSVCA